MGSDHASPGHYRYTDEELIQQLRELAEDGEMPSMARVNRSDNATRVQTFKRRLGSWDQIAEVAELELENPEQYSRNVEKLKERFRDDITELARDETAPPIKVYERIGEVPVHTVLQIYDSWAVAVSDAELGRPSHSRVESPWRAKFEPEYGREELLEWIQLYAREYGEVPKREDVYSWPGPKWPAYREEFETWQRAVRLAGFEPQKAKSLSKADIARQLRRFVNHEGTVSSQEFQEHLCTCSSHTVIRRFGSWRQGLEAAGIEVEEYSTGCYSKRDLIREIRWFVENCGSRSSVKFDNHSETCSVSTIQRRFGSWRKGLQAAGVTPLAKGKTDVTAQSDAFEGDS